MSQATYDDANLILKLYEMRREPTMRAARAWFSNSFKAKTMDEFNELCPKGSEPNAWARQVISYWDMVASFLNAGVLSQELFFQSGRELLFVWIRVQPLVAEIRALYKDPGTWKNLETAGNAFAEYTKKISSEGYETFAARVRG